MGLFDKILGALHFNFLNRQNSPSHKNVAKAHKSHIESLQQAGRDIINETKIEIPIIEVSYDSAVSDLTRYDQVNIFTTMKSDGVLIIEECIFDGVPTSHGNKRLDPRDVFHFDTINKNNITDGYEPIFILKIRNQSGERFLFESKLLIKQFGNRYDLMVLGNETIEHLRS